VEDALTLRAALIESNNAAAAELQRQVSSARVIEVASHAGLDKMPDVPSLALGTGDVTPLELTAAYSVFPGGGQVVAPRGILSVVDAEGSEILAPPVATSTVVSEETAFQMVSMLRDVIDRGTGHTARSLGVRGPVGGKTGTTDDYHDAWFVGFSSNLVAGVWVGFDQPAPIGQEAYAARVALPIWSEFMTRAARERPPPEFAVPAGLETRELCSVSYLRPVDGCPKYVEYFKSSDRVPSDICRVHEGSFAQDAQRVVGGFLRSLGGRLRGIFGGKG
jgi:penicillin-binding protein 1A